MPDELDVLLARIEDHALRADLERQVDRLRSKKRFGLVFEDHVPERVRLPHHPVRRGVFVVKRGGSDDQKAVLVEKVDGRKAFVAVGESNTEVVSIEDLVVVAEFGDPIYPGLRQVGEITQDADRPFHVVIKGENHHALEALQFTHAGAVDCIYIDPPYNTGARDWKYDNRYVDDNDGYRHSKWLAFMDRRLRLAKQLLNLERSVLIVTIDEKEYLRLGLLLEQLFSGHDVQMVTSVVNPKGSPRRDRFSRADEYLFFVFLGDAYVAQTGDDMLHSSTNGRRTEVRWAGLRRNGANGRRVARPNLFYPIFFHERDATFHSVGDPLPLDRDRETVMSPPGTFAVLPVREDGTEMTWGLGAETLLRNLKAGYVKFGRRDQSKIQQVSGSYLPAGPIKDIEDGKIAITGEDSSGAPVYEYIAARSLRPMSTWNRASHSAGDHGASLLNAILPDRRFPFPKSLYAVEDALRFVVRDNPHAVVLDFFAGSGTTTHAVMRLNRQDAGSRCSIVITNNEVSADEAAALREAGRSPGDDEWEAWGIYEYITKPRVIASVTGRRPDGEPIEGSYKFTDEFPISEGFSENVRFFELLYLDPDEVELDLAFESVAPLLWMRAGCRGPLVSSRPDDSARVPFLTTSQYGVLFDTDKWRAFINQLPSTLTTVFLVTDSQTIFTGIASELPSSVQAVRLYENYLTTFAINYKQP
ncbi:MAG: site-specific DNA-methyltransferase [Actinomycetota bacterium]|nr:site-specific DNA-methyltransferase [Actinomycetota bacterium]